ncbi:MAG TPA: aspartyl protease family protein [Phycisphaerae bacterium]|jgi:hypothetical protein
MRFDGEWLACEDGVVRPVIRAEILAAAGAWRAVEFLVDSGADRTVISANVLESLGLPTAPSPEPIGGVGGLVASVSVRTQIRLTRNDGGKVILHGEYAAIPTAEALDLSVLGRDILNLFALIVDRAAAVVTIIGARHHYTIEER